MTSTPEMAFVRALSVHGVKFASGPSNDDKRERIRIAILDQRLEDKKFSFNAAHKLETYREAFERCYHRSLDMRRPLRDNDGKLNSAALIGLPIEAEDDDETE